MLSGRERMVLDQIIKSLTSVPGPVVSKDWLSSHVITPLIIVMDIPEPNDQHKRAIKLEQARTFAKG